MSFGGSPMPFSVISAKNEPYSRRVRYLYFAPSFCGVAWPASSSMSNSTVLTMCGGRLPRTMRVLSVM